MPVAVRNSPFDNSGDNKKYRLKVPQARVLAALVPEDPTWPEDGWSLLNRANLGVSAGYTAISGTITRALNGIREGSTSGEAHPGLLALGYVEEVMLDVEGVVEVNYRATQAGALAYIEWMILNSGRLPEVKDRGTCVNDRYKTKKGMQ